MKKIIFIIAFLLALGACKKDDVQPEKTKPKTPVINQDTTKTDYDPELYDNVKELDGASIGKVYTNSDNQIRISSGKYHPGEIIYSGISYNTPHGLLLKVDAVSASGSYLFVENSSLDQAIKKLKWTLQNIFIFLIWKLILYQKVFL